MQECHYCIIWLQLESPLLLQEKRGNSDSLAQAMFCTCQNVYGKLFLKSRLVLK